MRLPKPGIAARNSSPLAVFKLSLPAFVDGVAAELSFAIVDAVEVGAVVEQAASAVTQSHANNTKTIFLFIFISCFKC